MKFLLLVPLMWINCFTAKITSIPEDAHVISSEEENEMKVFDGNLPLDTSYEFRYPDGSFEFFIELPNGEVDWSKGFFMQLDAIPILIKEGFSIVWEEGYWKTELYMIDHQGFHKMASSKTLTRPSIQRIKITVEELMKSWPKRVFHDEQLEIGE
ncbi:hypothetical protein ACFFRR_001821 [Megaselia abdita]